MNVFDETAHFFSTNKGLCPPERRYLLRTVADRKLHLLSSGVTEDPVLYVCAHEENTCVCGDRLDQWCLQGARMIGFVDADFLQGCQKMPAHCLFELNQSISQQESITAEARGSAVSFSLD